MNTMTYSGNLMLRIPPELHARAATAAEADGKSLSRRCRNETSPNHDGFHATTQRRNETLVKCQNIAAADLQSASVRLSSPSLRQIGQD